MHVNTLCKKNYECVAACPYGSSSRNLIDEDSYPVFNNDICKSCETRECIESCPEQALRFTGRNITVDDLLKRVLANIRFYKNSGGGVTFSGGEPFLQTEFIKNFIEKALPLGISFGAETCGVFEIEKVKEIYSKLEFLYYDLKCMDGEIHKIHTGSTNRIILDNLKKLAGINPDIIIVSVPVVPGVNAGETQIDRIASFCKECGIKEMRLLPYHSFGRDKYSFLGREYKMDDGVSVSEEETERFVSIVTGHGISCKAE